MKAKVLEYLGVSLSLLLTGCVVRTYPLTRDRVDQDLTAGNRGYLMGQSSAETAERKPTRTTQVVEVELRSPIKFERMSKTKPKPVAPVQMAEPAYTEGNRGYIMESVPEEPVVSYQKYTVQKNDTLQKISQKFYGTTKKWKRIFEANKETLKAPDKIRPGQVLKIPQEQLGVSRENLK